MENELPKLYTIKEIAQKYGISAVTQWRDRKRGVLPYRKIGGIKYTAQDIETYIASTREK